MQSLKRPTQQFETDTQEQEEAVEPLSNYNVMVLDQHFLKKLLYFIYQYKLEQKFS
jgi:hypothetical protein